MATELDVNQVITISKVKRRTWRVECFTEEGTDYEFVAHREVGYYDQNGVLVKRERDRTVRRRVSQVLGEADAMAMLASVRAMADRWEEEDIAAEAAANNAEQG